MSDARKCDDCGTFFDYDGMVGKGLHVTRNDGGTIRFGDHPGPWDFCSWRCLHFFANRMMAQEVNHDPPR